MLCMKIKTSNILGFFLCAFCVGIWGISFVSTKYILTTFTSFEILVLRFLTAYAFLWILKPIPLRLPRIRDEIEFALAGFSGVFIYQLTENLAINYTNASNVSIIVSISPIFTAITSQIFLHKKIITHWFIIGFALAITGVALVCFNGVVEFHLNPIGDFLALLSCTCWGFYSLFISKINQKHYNQIQSTRRIFMYALIFMIPVIIVQYSRGTLSLSSNDFHDIYNILNIMFLGIVASGLCFVFWNKACSLLGTIYTSLGIYLIPVMTIIFAAIFLGEKITVMGAVGTVFAIAGVFISSIKRK